MWYYLRSLETFLQYIPLIESNICSIEQRQFQWPIELLWSSFAYCKHYRATFFERYAAVDKISTHITPSSLIADPLLLYFLYYFIYCDFVTLFMILRPHRSYSQMRPVATDGVAWSVCLSVCWSHSWVQQKRLNRSRCRLGADSNGSKEPCIRWGSRSLNGRNNFGLSGSLKSIVNLCCSQSSKRDHYFVKGHTAKRITHFWIKRRNAMLPFVEILWQVFLLAYVVLSLARLHIV